MALASAACEPTLRVRARKPHPRMLSMSAQTQRPGVEQNEALPAGRAPFWDIQLSQ